MALNRFKANRRRYYTPPVTLRAELEREFEFEFAHVHQESPEARLERLREFRRTEEEVGP